MNDDVALCELYCCCSHLYVVYKWHCCCRVCVIGVAVCVMLLQCVNDIVVAVCKLCCYMVLIWCVSDVVDSVCE